MSKITAVSVICDYSEDRWYKQWRDGEGLHRRSPVAVGASVPVQRAIEQACEELSVDLNPDDFMKSYGVDFINATWAI